MNCNYLAAMKGLFMVAILPPEGIKQELEIIRTEFSKRFNVSAALRNPIHITLLPPFHLDEDQEATFIQFLEHFAATQKPANIKLDGYGTFPKNKVIFIRVTPDRSLKVLYFNLVSAFESGFSSVKVAKLNKHSYRPHVTLGYRDLDKAVFEDAAAQYIDKQYSCNWKAEMIHLWKRSESKWDTVAAFVLNK